ncbi:hypothetical protein AWH56_012875 [Anaerobacillus isosaccharinicus]|uniref:DUF4440 domain-containing protein n=1 Tax=Anaerobacillus isosaccharinicus TaxID=1532552 RepID=A0A1S2M326_9BACI|nr:hypothetical protein [Anaerobacillus isosaccharinicus]MBA5588212.1 hypothetical protein [Anaerobacillus isosaccharinicus]QOY38340.1 hypothetical protein AWH56_012875 [Anaerobacillus isosaccharinicus]
MSGEQDKKRIHETIEQFYNIISGNKEEVRDWDKFRSLFLSDNSSLAPIKSNSEKKSFNVNSFISRQENFLRKNNFYEYGLSYKIEIFGEIAHVYSQYEAKKNKEDIELIKQGVTLVQMVKDNQAWKIHSMIWQS